MSVLTIHIENALNITNKMEDSNERATIKRYGLT